MSLAAGPNELLLKLAHVGERPIRMYAAFLPPGEAVPATGGHPLPSLPWFQPGGELVWDVHEADHPRVGWLRFEAPPGTREMRLPVQAAGARVWVDGTEVATDAGRVTLAQPANAVVPVAVRLQQHPGRYAGAAMPEPVAFTCEPSAVELADWSELALGSYSGGAQYRTRFRLEQHHLDTEIELDLGLVHTTAEVTLNGTRIGVALRPPYRLRITEQAQSRRQRPHGRGVQHAGQPLQRRVPPVLPRSEGAAGRRPDRPGDGALPATGQHHRPSGGRAVRSISDQRSQFPWRRLRHRETSPRQAPAPRDRLEEGSLQAASEDCRIRR